MPKNAKKRFNQLAAALRKVISLTCFLGDRKYLVPQLRSYLANSITDGVQHERMRDKDFLGFINELIKKALLAWVGPPPLEVTMTDNKLKGINPPPERNGFP